MTLTRPFSRARWRAGIASAALGLTLALALEASADDPYTKYAKAQPRTGLTRSEFRRYLVESNLPAHTLAAYKAGKKEVVASVDADTLDETEAAFAIEGNPGGQFLRNDSFQDYNKKISSAQNSVADPADSDSCFCAAPAVTDNPSKLFGPPDFQPHHEGIRAARFFVPRDP